MSADPTEEVAIGATASGGTAPTEEVAIGATASGGTATIPDHECSGNTPPAEVYVDDTKLPILNEGVRTEMRRDGVLDVTKYSEVYFAGAWHPRDDTPTKYAGAVRALDPNKDNVYDPVDIWIQDELTGELELVHRGFVLGIGGGARGNIERRMTVGDPAILLGAIGFDEEYERGAGLEDVVEDVIERMKATEIEPNVFESISLADGTIERISEEEVGVEEVEGEGTFDSARDTIADAIETAVPVNIVARPFLRAEDLSTVNEEGRIELQPYHDRSTPLSRFIRSAYELDYDYQHSCADALRDVQGMLDGVFYFTAAGEDGSAIELVYTTDPQTEHTATHVDAGGDVQVLQNNALHEIRPINTLEVRGDSRGGEYPYAVIEHDELLDRANVALLDSTRIEDVTATDALENKGKEELKERIQEESLGSIRTELAPQLTPYSDLEAKPACGNRVGEDATALTYEVESVVHKVSAQVPDREQRRLHETQLKVTIPAAKGDMSVVESGYEDDGSVDSTWRRALSAITERALIPTGPSTGR